MTAAVVVCDDFGVVLYRAGRPEVLRVTHGVDLVPGRGLVGADRGHERDRAGAGTRGSAQVYAAEHYLQALHGFS